MIGKPGCTYLLTTCGSLSVQVRSGDSYMGWHLSSCLTRALTCSKYPHLDLVSQEQGLELA